MLNVGTINSDDEIKIEEEPLDEPIVFNDKFKFDLLETDRHSIKTNISFKYPKLLPEIKKKDKEISQNDDDVGVSPTKIKDDVIMEESNEVLRKEDTYKEITKKVSAKKPKDFFDETFVHPTNEYKSFIDLHLSRPIIKALSDQNIHKPTKIQSAAIPIGTSGRDICACAKTGSGKTISFLVPIFERLLLKQRSHSITRVLIIEPTRELAIQVFNVAKTLSVHTEISIALATGGIENRTQQVDLRRNPDIIIGTPGRLIDHLYNCPSFNLQSIEILVLDEADRLLDDSFTDQVKEIVRLSSSFRQTMLFSATMTDKVEDLMLLSLNKPIKLFIDSNVSTVNTLQQEFIKIKPNNEHNRMAIVLSLCHRNYHDNCLVFFPTKQMVHRARIIFELFELKVTELHGDLTQTERSNALIRFKQKDVDILVATDLASRGLDIDDIKTVINYSMPSSIKEYIHRVGRTARAGKSGRSITLVGEEERKMLKQLMKTTEENSMKSRIVSSEIIDYYQNNIELFSERIKFILNEDSMDRELKMADRKALKIENMIKFNDEIMSRPKKRWLKTKKSPSSNNNQLPDLEADKFENIQPTKLTKGQKFKENAKKEKELDLKKQKNDARFQKNSTKFIKRRHY